MKTFLKRLSAFVLAAALIAAGQPAAHADGGNTSGEWTYSTDGSTATVTGYTGRGGDVQVPATLGGLAVKAVGDGAFRNCASLVSAQLPAGVTVIGAEAFLGCARLATVKLPDSLIGIGQSAFAGCTALKSVTVPKWVNSIAAHAFEGCTALEKAWFMGEPPAISASAFAGTAAGFTACFHVSQTGWGSFTVAPSKPFCRLTLELLDGTVAAAGNYTLAGDRLDAPPADPIRQGYAFGGWFREAALVNKWDSKTDMIAGDIVLYAKWTPSMCKVTFDSQGGGAVATVTAPYGTTLTPPAIPAYQGRFFGGWYREAAFTHPWNFASDKLAGSMTLYARWLVPAAPEGMTAQSSSYDSVTLRWKAAEGVTGYEVYRSNAADGRYVLIGTPRINAFRDRNLVTGTQYYYRVLSYKQLETERIVSAFSKAVPAVALPAAPAKLTLNRFSNNAVELAWGAVDGVTKYEVWRAGNAAGPFALVRIVSGAGCTDTRLTAGVAYYYEVRAYRVVRGKKVYGPFSAVQVCRPR